jgi:hypothetical protein
MVEEISKSRLLYLIFSILVCTFCCLISFSQSKKEQILIKQLTIDSLNRELIISNKTINKYKRITDSLINEITIHKNQNIICNDSINSKIVQLNYLKNHINSSQTYYDSLINTLPLNYRQLSDSSLISNENYSSILKDFIDDYDNKISVVRYKCPSENNISVNSCKDYEISYDFYFIDGVVSNVYVFTKGYDKNGDHYNPIWYSLYFDYYGNTIAYDDHCISNHNNTSNQVGIRVYFDKNKISNQEFYVEWRDFTSNTSISKNYQPNETENIEKIIVKNQSLYGLEEYNKIKNQLYKTPNLTTFLKINNIDK